MRRLLLLLVTVLATVTATAVSAAMLAGPAAAAQQVCHQEAVKNADGSITYHLVCEQTHPGQPGTPGGGQEEDCGQDQVTPGPATGRTSAPVVSRARTRPTSCRWRCRPPTRSRARSGRC